MVRGYENKAKAGATIGSPQLSKSQIKLTSWTPSSVAAICDPLGPSDLLPLTLFSYPLTIRFFPAQGEKQPELGKESEIRHGQPDRRGPTGHKSQPRVEGP